MLLAAVNEAALLIARAQDPRDALVRRVAAVGTLLDRLVPDHATKTGCTGRRSG